MGYNQVFSQKNMNRIQMAPYGSLSSTQSPHALAKQSEYYILLGTKRFIINIIY
ncbi:hypothetical protein Hanom_Chr04g00372371 [Helianthus anomalus]